MANTKKTTVEQQLFDLLAESNRVPFLFVGSGVSQRYMGTEDWEGLLKWVCTSVGGPMQPFYVYKQQAFADSDKKNTVYPRLATLMEQDFLSATTEDRFSSWVKQNESQFEAGTHPMKVYIANHLAKARPTKLKSELDLLRHAARHVSGVVTTNYDKLMESVFPTYDVYYNQEKLLFSPLTSMGEIYKIHGSIDDPDSMVLNEQDYKKFEERRNYLLAKIFTVFGEYPIIFLGYSLGDQDIRELLSAIASCAGMEQTEQLSKRFVFVKYSREPCAPSMNTYVQNLDEGQAVTMTQITANDFSLVYKAIARTHQLYAPRVLGQLQKQIFDINGASEDAEHVVFIDIKDLSELPQDKKVVIGLRKNEEYGRPISVDELYEDVVLDNKHFNPRLVVSDYLEKFLNGNNAGLPMFKYVVQYDNHPLANNIQRDLDKRKEQGFQSYGCRTLSNMKPSFRSRHRNLSVKGLIDEFGQVGACRRLMYLDEEEISVEELERLLKGIMELMPPNFSLEDKASDYYKYRSEIKRCIRIYDYLKNGKAYLSNR